MRITRTVTALAVTSAALAALALPTAATAAPARARCGTAPTVPTTLPPLRDSVLRGIIAGLPNEGATGAIFRIRGTAGCWDGTSGVADLDSGRPVPQDGRFRIGSVTKTFTAATALQLAAEGRLNLDRTVQHYLPRLLPASYPPITVRQVLTFTSGINLVSVPHKTPAWFFAHRYDTWAPGSQLDLGRPLAFRPGTKQRYGNADYIVAGLLIERVTGRTWVREVTDRIIKPLRLTGTVAPGTDRRIHGPHAHGYESMPDGSWVDVTEANPSLQWSAGSIVSTAPDLDRFLAALFAGRVVPAKQLAVMFTVPKVPTFDGDADPSNDQPAVHSAGLTDLGSGLWGKSGDRPGYTGGMGATRDGSRRLVYSVNTTHMGGAQPEFAMRFVGALYNAG